MSAAVPWPFLLATDVVPERLDLLGRTVDIELGFRNWDGDGRLVAEAWRFHLGCDPDEDLCAPSEGGWFRRIQVRDHLVAIDGRYRLSATDAAVMPEDCFLAVGLPDLPDLFIWSLGYGDDEASMFVFVVDESSGVEWHGDDPFGDPDLHDPG